MALADEDRKPTLTVSRSAKLMAVQECVMIFPQLAHFTDLALLLLRVIVAVEYFESGRRSFFQAEEHSSSSGMSKGFTQFLGLAEMAGALGVGLGVLTQLAALGLILIMLGCDPKEDHDVANRLLG